MCFCVFFEIATHSLPDIFQPVYLILSYTCCRNSRSSPPFLLFFTPHNNRAVAEHAWCGLSHHQQPPRTKRVAAWRRPTQQVRWLIDCCMCTFLLFMMCWAIDNTLLPRIVIVFDCAYHETLVMILHSPINLPISGMFLSFCFCYTGSSAITSSRLQCAAPMWPKMISTTSNIPLFTEHYILHLWYNMCNLCHLECDGNDLSRAGR